MQICFIIGLCPGLYLFILQGDIYLAFIRVFIPGWVPYIHFHNLLASNRQRKFSLRRLPVNLPPTRDERIVAALFFCLREQLS
jgi:hypothetical protein